MKLTSISVILLAVLLSPLAAQQGDLTIRSESVPDSVIIYPGNLIFGMDRIVLPQGSAEILLPAQIIAESLVVLDNGKPLTGYKTKPDPNTGRIQLLCPSSGTGSRELRLGYLFRGASWTPTYNLTVLGDDRVRLDFSAAIDSGSLTLEGTELRLLSGIMISEDLFSRQIDDLTLVQNNIGYLSRTDRGDADSQGISVEGVGEHYLYPAGKVDIVPGERMVLSVGGGEMQARKVLVWDTRNGDRTETIYKVTNGLDVPLPPGLVRIYQEGIYVGSDRIEWTPKGGEGSVTAAGMTGIRVRKQVSRETSLSGSKRITRFTVTLSVENLSGKKAALTVMDPRDGSGGQFEYSKKPAEQPGDLLRWELSLDHGGKEVITYKYTVESY